MFPVVLCFRLNLEVGAGNNLSCRPSSEGKLSVERCDGLLWGQDQHGAAILWNNVRYLRETNSAGLAHGRRG